MNRRVHRSSSLDDATERLTVSNVNNDDPIRLWVGTWNIGFADPFETQRKNHKIIENLIPYGYDIYVLGMQEGVTERIYDAIGKYLNDSGQYNRVPLTDNAVYGFGDGALTSKKYTGIAMFVKDTIRSRISKINCTSCGFGMKSGSKGGVACQICLDDHTTFAFVSCHLEANNVDIRRKQVSLLDKNLCEGLRLRNSLSKSSSTRSVSYSKEMSFRLGPRRFSSGLITTNLTDSFDHVIWMGDLNYRITSLDPNGVLKMLNDGKIKELHEKHDSLIQDMRECYVFPNFREAEKHPEFCPSYKKIRNRGEINMNENSNWAKQTYVTKYKIPLYKRVFRFRTKRYSMKAPGWTDRILLHSKRVDEDTLHTLVVEEKEWGKGGVRVQNYNVVNNGLGMDVSDHSPVYCTFSIQKIAKLDLAKNENKGSASGHSRRTAS